MSALLLVLIPPALLAIVLLLCFVGCSFEPGTSPISEFTHYSDQTILPTVGLVGYWPLGERGGGDNRSRRHQRGAQRRLFEPRVSRRSGQ